MVVPSLKTNNNSSTIEKTGKPLLLAVQVVEVAATVALSQVALAALLVILSKEVQVLVNVVLQLLLVLPVLSSLKQGLALTEIAANLITLLSKHLKCYTIAWAYQCVQKSHRVHSL